MFINLSTDSHTHWMSWTSDHPVSVVIIIMNFLLFQLLSNCNIDLLQKFWGCFLGWLLLSFFFFKLGCYHYSSWNCVQFLASTKNLYKDHQPENINIWLGESPWDQVVNFLKNPRCGLRHKSILDIGLCFLKSRRCTTRWKTWQKPRCDLGQEYLLLSSCNYTQAFSREQQQCVLTS